MAPTHTDGTHSHCRRPSSPIPSHLSLPSSLTWATWPTEPTSGLDSTTSFAVIGALKSLSRMGANVIAVLHQPSYQIFEMFDDVIFLARGGFSVYVGPANEALRYFTSSGFTCPMLVNPAGECRTPPFIVFWWHPCFIYSSQTLVIL
jgi:hypothetical protein